MNIRKANISDYNKIVELIFLVMEEILYNFIGKSSIKEATDFLTTLVLSDFSQYSFNNCWLVETDSDGVVAVAVVYNGDNLLELRKTTELLIESRYGKELLIEPETEVGEYYLDCLSVSPNMQNRGIGTAILKYLIDEYVDKRDNRLGLIVEKDNIKAKELYLKLGFKYKKDRIFVDKVFEHLQISKENCCINKI